MGNYPNPAGRFGLTLAAALIWITNVSAEPGLLSQTPILASANAKPNILIVIDDSGSMGARSSAYAKTRMQIAKDATISLLDQLSNVRVGIASFASWGGGAELDHQVADLHAHRSSIYEAVRNLYPMGGTPLVQTLQNMGRYFVGFQGAVNPGNQSSANCERNGQYSRNGALVLHPETKASKASKATVENVFPGSVRLLKPGHSGESPICYWCQQNFVILLTDGYANQGASSPLRNYCDECWHDLISVAKALNDIDLRPDVNNFDGESVKNNLTIYTIGFNTSQSLLKAAAREGGGIYLEASDEDQLKAAFAKIAEDISAQASGSASAGSFSSRSLEADSTFLFTTFDTEFWTGDVLSHELDNNTGELGGKVWSAAERLDSATNFSERVMMTWKAGADAPDALCPGESKDSDAEDPEFRPVGIPFRWGSLSPGQQRDLLTRNAREELGIPVFERKWGSFGSQAGRFKYPVGVAVGNNGVIYVADQGNHRIQRFDRNGTFLGQWGGRGSADGMFYYPGKVAVDISNNVYVTDVGNHRVQKFDAEGNFLRKWGSYGSSEGKFYHPFGIAVGIHDDVYVTDFRNHRVQRFDADGVFIEKIGSYGWGLGQFRYPDGISINSGGKIYVSDRRHRIQIFDSSGAIGQWGTYGWGDGQFRAPLDVSVDSAGSVYVLDGSNRRVQKFDASGNFLNKFGNYGYADGEFRYPWGIASDAGSACVAESIFVVDSWRHNVQKFSFGGSASSTADIGQARLDYLRGDRESEGRGFNFRKRTSLLGDVVHSSAVYVGKPNLKWPDGGAFPTGSLGYSQFVKDNEDRNGVVYVGANDGMLHAFEASTGREILAYLPGNLFSSNANAGYHFLTQPNYTHRYYVDGTPVISDAFIRTRTSDTDRWRSILVGSEGAGGRGLFALDVTSPSRFKENLATEIVLWEFNDQHDDHFGFSLSKPTVALLGNGRWAVIVGNGYEHTATDSTGGQAELFLIYLDGGLDGQWTEGKDYLRIPTGVGSPDDRNGLSTPAAIDTNNDQVADRVYAGDLFGNIWVFDLTSSNPNKWGVAGDIPLFSTKWRQPITVKPEVIRHPNITTGGNNPNVLVLFGTGQYLVAEDNTTTDTQTFYSVWDRGDLGLERSDLVEQALLPSKRGGRVTDPYRWRDLNLAYKGIGSGDRYGWFLDLPERGERVVTDARYRNDLIYFNTLIPTDPKPCATGGTGWMMSVRADTGGSPLDPAFDFDGDGEITIAGDTVEITLVSEDKETIGFAGKKYDSNKGVPTGVSIIGNRRYTPGTDTDTGEEIEQDILEESEGKLRGRLSWQQLYPE